MRSRAHSIAVILLFLVVAGPMRAQDIGLVVDHLSQANGLRGTVVMCSMVDSTNQLWVGTDSGICVVDGNQVTPVDTGQDLILVAALHEASDGTIWVGHARGLGRIRGGRYESIALPPQRENGSTEYRVVDLLPQGESLVVASHQGLLRIGDDARARRIEFQGLEEGWRRSADLVFSLLDSPTHGFLVGGAAGTFVLSETDELTLLCRIGGLSMPFEARSTWAMIEAMGGLLVLGSRSGSFCYDPASRSVKPLETNGRLGFRDLPAVDYELGENGEIWVASPWGSFASWNTQTKRIRRYSFAIRDSAFLKENSFSFSIARSDENLIWVSSAAGVYSFEDGNSTSVIFLPDDRNKDRQRQVHDAIQFADGSLYLAAGLDGMQAFTADLLPMEIDDGGLTTEGVNRFYRSGEESFVFSNRLGEVLRCERGKLHRILDERVIAKTALGEISLCPLKDGRLLVAGRGGLYEFDADGRSRELEFADGRPFAGPFTVGIGGLLEDSQGSIWACTQGALIRIDPDGQTFRYGGSKIPEVELVIPGDRVRQINEVEPGRYLLLLAGRLGILDRDAKVYSDLEFHQSTRRNLGFIHRLLIDDQRRVWALAASSLLTLDLEKKLARECHIRFSSSDLISSNLFRAAGGQIMAADGEGLHFIDTDEALEIRRPPAPVLKAVAILGDQVPVAAWSAPQELPEDHNRITFEVRSGSLRRAEQTRFAMRLKGADDDWQDVGFDGRIDYVGLDPGDYVFEARADDGSGAWSEARVLARFTILTPIWKTAPFQVSVGLLLGLLLVLGFRRQVGLERRRAQALEQIVTERTESLRTKSDELERLYNVVKNINVATTLDELMRTTLSESMAMLGADAGRFYVAAESGWDLAVTVGWRMVPGKPMADDLALRLGEASPAKPFEQLVHRPEDVVDLEGRQRQSCCILMYLYDEGRLAACMILDYWERLQPATAFKLNLVERLYQPVMLAYRKLRLLETAERLNNLKNELLGAAAHDLRSPLTVIGMTAEMMRVSAEQGRTLGEVATREIELIKNATTRMSAMVDKLLDISAIESGRVEVDLAEIDLRRVVRDRVDFFVKLAESRRIELRLDGDPTVLPVHADVERIGTALDNLLSNALKYTPSGGAVQVSCARKGGEVVVEVTDDGQGLPPEDARDLFNTFRRMSATPSHGELSSGLGLAIVKRIIDLHGGRVFARSRLNLGSTFGFALPLRREPASI